MVLKGTLKRLKHNQNSQSFQNSLELLTKDIEMNLSIKLEFKGLSTESAWQSAIIEKITQIRIHRIAFCNILDFIYTERHMYEGLLTLSNDYKNLASMWGIINSLLYKGFFENDSTVRVKIVDKMKEITNSECAAITKLSEIIDQYQQGKSRRNNVKINIMSK